MDRGRVAEIQKLIHLRHGGPCNTDDGTIYLQAVLPHLLRLHAGPELLGRVLGWAQTWLPCVPADQIAESLDTDDAEAAALLGADALATLLRVHRQERADLGLRTIGATNFTRRQRLARRRRNDAVYQAAKRKAAGATPRAESNVAKAKALGISLSTYKRRLAKGLEPAAVQAGEPISSAIVRSTYNPLRVRVTASEPTVPGPARQARPALRVGVVGHSPGGKARAVPAGRAVAMPLPVDGVSEHPDLLGGGEWRQVGAPLIDYDGGVLPPKLVRAVRDAQRARQITQHALARQIGVSQPQLANALQGRFGLSKSAATSLLEWLAA